MEQIRTVYKYNERRRLCGSLSHVIYFQSPALVGGWLDPCCGIGKNIIEHTRSNSHAVLRIYAVDKGVKLVDPLTCFCGDEMKGT